MSATHRTGPPMSIIQTVHEVQGTLLRTHAPRSVLATCIAQPSLFPPWQQCSVPLYTSLYWVSHGAMPSILGRYLSTPYSYFIPVLRTWREFPVGDSARNSALLPIGGLPDATVQKLTSPLPWIFGAAPLLPKPTDLFSPLTYMISLVVVYCLSRQMVGVDRSSVVFWRVVSSGMV